MQWKQLSIDGKPFLSQCVIENDRNVKFYLSDFENLWKEEGSVNEILSRAREQNKRIEYDNETITSTLVSLPSQVLFRASDHIAELDFKYYVSNRPFNFKWKLERCEQKMFTEVMLHPLLLTVSSLAKQKVELIDVIKKKDLEIEQYKLEGVTLKRYKLVTEKFDPEEYERNISFKAVPEFLAFADDKFSNLINQEYGVPSLTNSPQKKASIANSHRFSPKSKKNSGYRTHIQQIQQKLEMPSQKVDFDESDSSTPPATGDAPPVFVGTEMQETQQREDNDVERESSSLYAKGRKKLKLSRKNLNL